ncbi:MAG TPA: WYL domain-containing protein [Acidimicrobiales bacterium]|nr:WYL domain-containing protein [Acidimicrobiales bacterium]
MSAAKLERLLNLTALLLATPRPVSAEEIHERLREHYAEDADAFRRAFERDKDALRSMGVPIVVETVPGVVPAVDGYRIPRDRYYLRDPGLTPEELAALRLAASVVRLEGLSARDALMKLGGFVGEGDEGLGLSVDSLPAAGVAPLFGAITDRHPVRFRYRGTERVVDPYRLDFARGRWYLSGHDHTRGADRLFRLDRLESPIEVVADRTFERPPVPQPGLPLDPWQLGEGEATEARVSVDAAQAPWIVQHLGPDAVVEERADGSVVVAMTVTNVENFRSFVLTFLDHAEILEPPELRDDLIAWLERQVAA